jgi:hypothetical protein
VRQSLAKTHSKWLSLRAIRGFTGRPCQADHKIAQMDAVGAPIRWAHAGHPPIVGEARMDTDKGLSREDAHHLKGPEKRTKGTEKVTIETWT